MRRPPSPQQIKPEDKDPAWSSKIQQYFRAITKNIADLIITKYKLNIDVPKIKKLEDKINANDEKIYEKEDFINVILKYLKKFNFNKFDINQLKIELKEMSK